MDDKVALYRGDCLDVMAGMDADSIEIARRRIEFARKQPRLV